MLREFKRRIHSSLIGKQPNLVATYLNNGRIPWSPGYSEYKEQQINKTLTTPALIESFKKKVLPTGYGIGIDERIVEYPWVFSNLVDQKTAFLDAGSTFNYKYLLEHPLIAAKTTTIYTYFPEPVNFNCNRISYVYGDLREIPFKDNCFNEVVCQSTLEHIGMDNSIYGYDLLENENKSKNYTYLQALDELIRILKINGMLLLTFPFGKFEHHGFFQQLDQEMLEKLTNILKVNGTFEMTFFKYLVDGWIVTDKADCLDVVSYNPHSGRGKGSDGAAHCRSICCIKFVKS